MASKRRQRRKGCTGKIRHNSKWAAAAHVHALITSGAGIRGQLHVYRCRFCRHWHVGHIPTPAKSRRK